MYAEMKKNYPTVSGLFGQWKNWRYRELLYFLVWRDLKIRYKETVLGVLWSVLQPILTMIVFTLFFGKLAKLPSDGVPYAVFCFIGLVPWFFVSNSIRQCSLSILGNAQLIRKVYFPRFLMPVSAMVSGLIDFSLTFVVLLIVFLIFGIVPKATILFLPYFILLSIILTMGLGLWLSALNAQFRDVNYLLPFLTQLWFFATPITFSSRLLSPKWQVVYALNPMVGIVEGFRWTLLQVNTPIVPITIVSSAVAILLLISGAWYFKKTERSFADIV